MSGRITTATAGSPVLARWPGRSRAGGLASAAAVVVGVAAWLGTVPVLRAVLTDNDRGLDAMDESHYLMAAQPWAADKAFNGVFGWYGGLLLRLVGQDLARYRLLGDLVLIAAALVLAACARRAAERLSGSPWPGWLRAAWPPAVVSAALCYYTIFVRTPSYNWFASVGLMLLVAGLLRAVAGPTATWPQALRTGSLLAVGAFVAAVGKATTAAGAAAVVLVALVVHALTTTAAGRAALARVVAAAAGVAVLLVIFHVTAVNGVSTTVDTYRRVSGMLATVDPWHYAPAAVRGAVTNGWYDVAVTQPWAFRWLLVLPLVASVLPRLRVPRPGLWLGGAALVAVGLPLRQLLATYPGGVDGLSMSVTPLVVAAEGGVLFAAVVVAWRGRGRGPAATALLLSATVFGIGLCYPFGTNVGYASQLPGGFVILLVGAALGVSCVPDGGRLVALAGLCAAAIALGSVLVPVTRNAAPYRLALLDQQTVPRSVVAGTPPILVDPDTARWIDDLRAQAAGAGFRPGTPVLDLTWHPGTVLVLGGRAPKTLLPAFPGYPTAGASARYSLEQEDPALWRAGWLVVLPGQAEVADQATAVLGLRFPQDYQQVGTVQAPFDGEPQELWRPRTGLGG